MNWEKISFSKRFGLICCIVPGLTVCFVIGAASPRLLHSFENAGFFGYNSKLALLVVVAFSVGFPIQAFLQSLQRRLILFPMVSASGKRRRELREREALQEPDPLQKELLPWESPLWQSLVKQLIPIELPGDGSSEDSKKICKELWEALDQFRYSEWEILESSPLRTIALSISSAATILLLGSLFVPALRWSWWSIPLQVSWVILLWQPPYIALRNRESMYIRQQEQLRYLMRIAVTRVAPTLEIR
jgi:hypothetical protein